MRKAAVVLVLLFAAAQLVRPNRANPPIDPSRTVQAHVPAELGAVLDRSCGDCHSYRTRWPSFTKVAPLSWLYAYAVAKGRAAVNFSEWAAYSQERQGQLLVASCKDVTAGKMPGVWASLQTETRLSPRDVELICAAAHGGSPR
ncbi:MAG: heme-binding domain-containing protein [Bacteroidota bacterium]